MAKRAIVPGHTIQICVNLNKSVTKQSLPVFPANIKKQVASAIPILLTKGHARLWGCRFRIRRTGLPVWHLVIC
ncbi:Hypothetical protein BROD_1577 [Brucella sp. NF 2653]|nr:Hypothetical protein BROD_1577 [Brucella sp. NF 2653]